MSRAYLNASSMQATGVVWRNSEGPQNTQPLRYSYSKRNNVFFRRKFTLIEDTKNFKDNIVVVWKIMSRDSRRKWVLEALEIATFSLFHLEIRGRSEVRCSKTTLIASTNSVFVNFFFFPRNEKWVVKDRVVGIEEEIVNQWSVEKELR